MKFFENTACPTARPLANRSASFVCIIAACVSTVGTAHAENWPGWRGPRGDGSSLDARVPTRWNGDTGENIVWKVPIPGTGHASPIVWNNLIIITSCLEETNDRVLMALDRQTGNTIWQRNVLQARLESKHSLNSYASSTPATDGKRVYVAFLEASDNEIPAPNIGNDRLIHPGKAVVAAYDLDGEQAWMVRIGDFVSAHGFCSCPVLFQDLVIVNADHDGDSYVVALEKETGEERWRIERQHGIRSYVTPIIREIAGRTQMVMSGSQHIASFDPHDGSYHWEMYGPTEQFVASIVYDGNLFFMTCGFPDYHVMGIRPDGDGEVTESQLAWHQTTARCYVPSPVVLDGYLLVADDRGTANCFDAKTGDVLWKERCGSHYSASLVHANGLAYLLADDGITKIVRPGVDLEVIAENPLGERCIASPAISNGQLIIRTEQNLVCIAGAAG